MSSRRAWLLAALLAGLYLFWNTGIHSDEYTVRATLGGGGFLEYLAPDTARRGLTVFGVPSYYLLWWTYYFVPDSQLWIYDVLKWLVHVASTWLVYRFATDYLSPDRALLASLLFVLSPMHDATTYWYMASSYVLAPALILYSHHRMRHNETGHGLAWGTLGAFMNYSSPPYAFGLAVVFLFERAYKKAALFLLPGALYVLGYIAIAILHPDTEGRLDRGLDIAALARNFVLQVVTFGDAALGPSMFLKIWWSAASIGPLSLLIGAVVAGFAASAMRSRQVRVPPSLWWGVSCVLVLALAMFALTGLYSQMAFNLGNRVTVYGALLVAFGVAALPMRRLTIAVVMLVFVIPVLGLSDHWKSWNDHQKRVVAAIRENPDLARLDKSDVLLVAGNMYSRLGPFSHVEFFSMPWVVQTLFGHVKAGHIMTLPPYVRLEGNTLMDIKNGRRLDLSNAARISIYESEENILRRVTLDELESRLSSRPPEIRHWVQLLGDGPLRSAILKLSPRLEYLFL